ncbi:VCBS repeat-containing protein [Hydrotalea sp.]|uniref:VCBS repeat-containing protein n=1 Tax=Hydrotalea sp. TaxID=2881279 RepID=UPI003D0D6C83
MHSLKYLFLLCIILVIGSCRVNSDKLLTKLSPDDTNIQFNNQLFDESSFNILNYIYFYNGGGVAIGDINNDGLPDILFTGNMVKNRLYLNKGHFKFEDITDKSGIASMQGWCTGATMVDINGDGKLDIYICRSADINTKMRRNLLFINNGDLTFTEKAQEYGLDNTGYSTQAAFFDYDKDGDLDMFLINHSLHEYTTGAIENPQLRNKSIPEFECKLYRNDWNEQLKHPFFTDVSAKAGITSNVYTFGLGLAISDLNNDGWPDVYISNDFNEPDYLFLNNGNGTFTDHLKQSMDHVSLYSMGSDAADYNNDGLIDLLTLDMLPEDNYTQKMHSGAENYNKFQLLFNRGFYYQYSRNMLQKNNGDGTFSEIGQLAGVSNTDWSWSGLFSDFDNDGKKDLLITNGYVKDYTDMDFLQFSADKASKNNILNKEDAVKTFIEKMPENKQHSYIFKNVGNDSFAKINNQWGLIQTTVSAGAAYVDLDNDGDMDIVMNNTNDIASVYKNNADKNTNNHFLKVKLQGDNKNINGIGAKVKLYCKNEVFYQEAFPVRGFQSSSDPILNFGIGSHTIIDSVVVIWPSDATQTIKNVKANQTIQFHLNQANNVYHYNQTISNSVPIFTQNVLSQIKYKGNDFNDFSIQPLLPNFLSHQGPCLAVADVNKDGLEDIFLGGSPLHPGQLFLQQKNGLLQKIIVPDFEKDKFYDDASAVFFDANGDGLPDLLVASTGYHLPQNDTLLQCRLYLNMGNGVFKKNINSVPNTKICAGVVKVADIDGDGDLDIFVGGRVIPGKYPQTPNSAIWLNDGKGHFTDVTPPNLKYIGMVTDATWLDVNGDKLPDLIVVGEFMPLKIYINQHGQFTDASQQYFHFPNNGWWNKIEVADMDNDGDMDLIIGNYGYNTQFKVSDKTPMELYYKDFDGNGSIDPILCYYINGISYPAFSKDDITEQIPSLKNKFLQYHDYANATITDLFSKEQLQDANQLICNNMATVYLENKGKDGFQLHTLPIEAQYAPIFGITVLDANKDRIKDILLTGNNTYTRIKFGRYDANHGILLLGDGKGNFTYVPQYKSGLKIRTNVRSNAIIHIGNEQHILVSSNDTSVIDLKFNH